MSKLNRIVPRYTPLKSSLQHFYDTYTRSQKRNADKRSPLHFKIQHSSGEKSTKLQTFSFLHDANLFDIRDFTAAILSARNLNHKMQKSNQNEGYILHFCPPLLSPRVLFRTPNLNRRAEDHRIEHRKKKKKEIQRKNTASPFGVLLRDMRTVRSDGSSPNVMTLADDARGGGGPCKSSWRRTKGSK